MGNAIMKKPIIVHHRHLPFSDDLWRRCQLRVTTLIASSGRRQYRLSDAAMLQLVVCTCGSVRHFWNPPVDTIGTFDSVTMFCAAELPK